MLSGGCAVGRVSIFGCVVLLGVVLLGVVLLGARLCEMCLDYVGDVFLRMFVIL